MAFHPLTLLGAQRGRAERYSLLKGCKRTRQWQFKLLLANVLVLSPSSSQCSALWPSKRVATWATGSLDQRLQWFTYWHYLETLLKDVGALNAGTFSIIHCPTLRDKGDIKFPLWLKTGSSNSNTPKKEKFVYQWPFLPHSPLPIPTTRKLCLVWKWLFSNDSLTTRWDIKLST